MPRKRISDRTKLAATLLALGDIPYDHAKLMTEDQIISLYHFDHNILNETQHPDRDKFWNLAPLLIRAHRAKFKLDMSKIAKSRRLRSGGWYKKVGEGPYPFTEVGVAIPIKPRRKLRSRGFDKTRRRKMSGEVVKREGRR